MMPMLRGVFVPHVTPFDGKGEVDWEALKGLVHTFEEAGLDGWYHWGAMASFPI